MVALFENGVTVAIAGWEYAASWSFSSQPRRHLGVAVEENDVAVGEAPSRG